MGGRSLVPTLPVFKAERDKALRIFNRLRLPDVIGTPRLEDATGDWFRDIVAALFGSYDVERNKRMIQEVFLLVPKKNGKSTNAAAIMVTAAIINRRPEAEFLLIAPTKEIADISFRQASGMIRLDPKLDALFHLQRNIRTITHRVSGAVIQIKASDTDAITGVKSTGILVDETHVFAAKPRAADVFVEVRGALAARPDGFMFQISTQSKTPPAGVFLAELRRARAVRDGKRSMPLLPVIYELPEKLSKEGAWRDPKNFRLVNPNLGRSVDEEFLARELESAENEGPAQLALFASQHLNVEIGLGLRSERWVAADYWELHADETLTLDSLIERCEVATVGIDGGGSDDLLGLAVIGRERGTRRWLLWAHAWVHEIALDRRKSEAARLRDFERDGDLTICSGMGEDVVGVADVVERLDQAALLPKKNAVGVDVAGISEIVDELARRGVDGESERVVGVTQGWKLMNAIKTAERRIVGGELAHCGRPLMAWCIGNAKVEAKGNAIMITKAAAGTAKIDPLMATFNAVALMSMNPEEPGGYTAERGLTFF